MWDVASSLRYARISTAVASCVTAICVDRSQGSLFTVVIQVVRGLHEHLVLEIWNAETKTRKREIIRANVKGDGVERRKRTLGRSGRGRVLFCECACFNFPRPPAHTHTHTHTHTHQGFGNGNVRLYDVRMSPDQSLVQQFDQHTSWVSSWYHRSLNTSPYDR